MNSPTYNIIDYGAIADGKTDCGPVINKILSILPASGGTILIPEGDFYVNTTINVTKNFITITGLNSGERSNVDVSVGTLTNPGGGSKLILGTAAAAITVPTLPDVNGNKNRISGLQIQNLLISGGPTEHGIGIDVLQDNDRLLISNVVCVNLTTGIYTNASDALSISSCWISECTNSIYLANGIQNSISNCQLGAQPTGITVKLDNQQNMNITGNQIYPDGAVNLQANNSQYLNISSNNFQSYYVGMIELNNSDNNILSNNLFWMKLPSDTSRQLRGKTNIYGVLQVTGNNNRVSQSSIFCDWANPNGNAVTVRSIGGTGNVYDGLSISDSNSARVFYVSGSVSIFDSEPAAKVYVDGSSANVNIQY
ncbi:MAG: right-handed parallel beta-helix repeat-containing protein [Bacteroidetes bacterium]|nr:right-handed parallel beta-helix repeat-containing protein [Bacteroidota bacterium]